MDVVGKEMIMVVNKDRTYEERVSSYKTEALFLTLTVLFLMLLIWRAVVGGLDILTIVFTLFFLFFSFYSLNYRTLVIRMTAQVLKLRFGIITWTVDMDNIEACSQDETSLWRIGGAGVHFSPIQGRYRAMFNFLEYPRVIISLKIRKGLVWDIAFSTEYPDVVLQFVQEAINKEQSATVT
jgi:Ca2+/Na+ antiporter